MDRKKRWIASRKSKRMTSRSLHLHICITSSFIHTSTPNLQTSTPSCLHDFQASIPPCLHDLPWRNTSLLFSNKITKVAKDIKIEDTTNDFGKLVNIGEYVSGNRG